MMSYDYFLAGTVLHLSAAKSVAGHAETAAGAIGLVSTFSAHTTSATAPVLHLADFNPLVASIITSASKETSLIMALPRQVRLCCSAHT